jgi:hypothetical protein
MGEGGREMIHTSLPWQTGVKHPCRIYANENSGFVGFTCNPVDEGSETEQEKANAAFIVECVNAHYALVAENERLREALKGLADNINLSKLNIRKDFSLMNAHAYALKVLDGAK